MGMNIKNPEAHALAREIAAREGVSVTEAVLRALRDKRAALAAAELTHEQRVQRILDFGRRFGALHPGGSSDTSDLYDELGLPK